MDIELRTEYVIQIRDLFKGWSDYSYRMNLPQALARCRELKELNPKKTFRVIERRIKERIVNDANLSPA